MPNPTPSLTDAELEQYEAVYDGLSDPWWEDVNLYDQDGKLDPPEPNGQILSPNEFVCSANSPRIAAFITTSRTAMPRLVAEVRRLRDLLSVAAQYMPREEDVTTANYVENTGLVLDEVRRVRCYLEENKL